MHKNLTKNANSEEEFYCHHLIHTSGFKTDTLKASLSGTLGRYYGGRRLSSDDSFHSPTVSTRQTEYHEALPSLVNDEVRCDCMFADDGSASWYSVCRMPMVEWRLDCEDCRHLTVISLHDTVPWCCRVSARSGRTSAGIMWLDEIASLIYRFCLKWAACTIIWRKYWGLFVCLLLNVPATC